MDKYMEFKSIDIVELEKKINSAIMQRPKYSNYFLPDLSNVSFLEGENTLILRKDYKDYNRIFFLSNDSEELSNALRTLSSADAINIPYRRELNSELAIILEHGGYSLFQKYERLYNNNVEQRGEFKANYAYMEDVDDMDALLHKHFHTVSDRLPSREELVKYTENKQVQVSRDLSTNKVNGLIIFSIEGKFCRFLEWASDASAGESLFLYLNAFNMMVEMGITKCTLWVRCGNVRARKIYDALGFQNDGLFDNTYLKINA